MDRTPASRADVCVVGAGPAGALVASRLASDGHDVVVLEAGPRFDFAERERRMEAAIRPAHDGSVWDMGGERDAFSASGEQYYPLNVARVKGVGGSTLHWQGMVMRLHPSDFDGGHDNDDPAWPIDYDDLRPYYADAERAMGVAGDADNPFAPPRDGPYPLPGFPPSYSDSLFAEACESLGVSMHGVPNARNSESYDGRGPCVGYGTCQPVCPSGAKYDASVHVEDAEAEGATVLDRVPVQRLETDADGRVSAAVYATPDGTEHRQEAREFVLAAGGVEIPRLLLLSRSEDDPDGLANSSGLVGRYFMDHLFAGAGGTLDERTRQNHVGFLTSECHQFYDDPGQAVRRVDDGETVVPATDEPLSPIKLEFLNYAGPSPVELALSADEWGDALLDGLRDAYGTSIAMGGLVGQPPRKENRVTLDTSTTDDHGNPVPDIQWSWGPRAERSMRRANDIQHAILGELGVDVSWTAGPDGEGSGPAYHHMGTTRMGTDPETSVVNPQLRAHDVENLSVASSSVFVTAGSMNPTLTIAALALKCADHVGERL
ncbi:MULTISPECIES: GMC family oxidoreductase [Haloarcula]|uniref:GMC family oxidoreductase n=1 Tax=Haloarcula pellucida TaxID=1427151 RepID=A0A830GHH5_9EURY|nr:MULTISPECIES: GMC family oxidoreductase [Halomicroarcula]MBX0347609.1 GMC family oxidoreductase [Halomicroarcula pellucida]MDS0276470.1 GMC family oxidoreductase [Halomicroarcula sp. S1AR25-4]GGN89539.1 GMC family oxidoreductase [Halomicroarcula pellucida]